MKIPAGRGQHVLYLDFDGVLHPENVYHDPRRGLYFAENGADHQLFENAPVLTNALAAYPGVRIVLSTSWVRFFGYSRARRYLPLELRRRVIGATYHSSMHQFRFARADQVIADVKRRCPAAWIAIDDVHDGWPTEALSHFVPSDPLMGCSAKPVFDDLVRKLASSFSDQTLMGASER